MVKKKQLIFVIGMHRSGTSLLTQMLNNIGINLGKEEKLLSNNEIGNIWGFYENTIIRDFNDQLLKKYNASWDNVKKIDYKNELIINNTKLTHIAETLLNNLFETNEIIAIKDPRLCIFLPFWEFVSKNYIIKYIFIYRKPNEVAHSLFVRNNIPLLKSLDLWYLYNKYAISFLEKKGYLITSHGSLLENPIEEAGRIAKYLNIEFHKKNTFKF